MNKFVIDADHPQGAYIEMTAEEIAELETPAPEQTTLEKAKAAISSATTILGLRAAMLLLLNEGGYET